MLDEKIKTIEFNINGIIQLNKQNVIQIKKIKTDVLEVKDYFSSNFNQVVGDITILLTNLESTNKTEEKDEESPASKITSLNLNWIPVENATNGNEVKNASIKSSYWCVKSEEVLDGAFICRILVEHITGTSDWHHGAGIIKYDKDTIMDSYYSHSCLFLSSGIFTKPYMGSNSNTRFPSKWKDGDEIIIKRDFNNDLWFGLNDEFTMMKSCKAEGKFRIVLGFLNSNKPSEVFKLIQLQHLTK